MSVVISNNLDISKIHGIPSDINGEYGLLSDSFSKSRDQEQIDFKKTDYSIYPGIPVSFEDLQIVNPIGANWFNKSYHYRLPVWINESSGIERQNELINLYLTFDIGQTYNQSIRVTEDSDIIPFHVWNETFYPGTEFYYSVTVSWLVNLTANEHKLYYIYWSDKWVGEYPDFSSDLTYTSTSVSFEVSTSDYEAKFTTGKGVTININGKEIMRSYSFAPTPFPAHPYNATYVLLDTGTGGDADYVKAIAWEDGTHVKFYGYDTGTQTWVLLKNATLTKNGGLRYPDEGPSTTYSLIKIETDKPVTIITGDIGVNGGANPWGVDHGSDDDLYTYYGQDIVLWVPKDLWISAYHNNTHVKIKDLSDGDDTVEITLNAREWWFKFSGTNGTDYFENDLVRVTADKPITIVGGFLDDNIFGEVRGFEQKVFVFPIFEYFGVVATRDNTEVRYWVYNPADMSLYTQGSVILDKGKGQQFGQYGSLDDDSGNPWDRGDIDIDEFMIGIVEANASIILFTGSDRYGDTGPWGGEGEYVSKFVGYISTKKYRWIKIVATESNTRISILRDGSTWDNRTLTNVGDVYKINVAPGEGILIWSDKPVVSKIYGGDQNPNSGDVPSEDMTLLVNTLPMTIKKIEPITLSSVLVKIRVEWEQQGYLHVVDEWTFWSKSNYFLLKRTLRKTFGEINGSVILMDVDELKVFDKQVINDVEENLDQRFISGTEFRVDYYNSSAGANSYAISIAMNGLSAHGQASVEYLASIAGYFKETHSIHLILGWNTTIYLPTAEDTSITLNSVITAGNFGSSITSQSQNNVMKVNNPVIKDVRNVEDILVTLYVNVSNFDPSEDPIESVRVTVESDYQEYSDVAYTNATGIAKFENVPAAEDYSINIYWTNNSPIYELFPEANHTETSLNIGGDAIVKFKIRVMDLEINIVNVDNKPLTGAMIHLEGNYTDTGTELVVNTTKFRITGSTTKFSNLPVPKSGSGYIMNYSVYVWYNTSSTLSPIELDNTSCIEWNANPTETTITIELPATKLTIYVKTKDKTELPGSTVWVNTSDDTQIAAGTTDIDGKIVFCDIPTNTAYKLKAKYVAYENISTGINVLHELVYNITMPFAYGTLTWNATFEMDHYYATIGSIIRIVFTMWDNESNVSVQADTITIHITNSSGHTIISGLIPTYIGEGQYYYDLHISNETFSSGDYTIWVNAYKIGYGTPDPRTVPLTVQAPVGIKIEAYGDKSEYWGANLTLWVNITDPDTGSPISGAIVYGIIEDTDTDKVYRNISLQQVGISEKYAGYTIVDGNITLGKYIVNITIKYQHDTTWEETYVVFPLDILKVPTNAFPNVTTLTIGYYENASVKVTYQRTDPHRVQDYVEHANVTYYVVDATTDTKVYPATDPYITATEIGSGEYEFTFNSSELGTEGNYIIVITLKGANFTKQLVNVSLTVTQRSTKAIPLQSSVDVVYTHNATLFVKYQTLDDKSITGATLTVTITGGQSINYVSWYDTDNEYYVVRFNTSQLGLGSFSVTITLTKEHYVSGEVVITLTINPIPTEALPSTTSETLEWGEALNITIILNRTDTDPEQSVSDLNNNTFIIYNAAGNVVYKGTLTEIDNREYRLYVITSDFINQTQPQLGTFIIYVFMEKTYHTNQTLVITLTVEEVSVTSYASQDNVILLWSKKQNVTVHYNRTRDDLTLVADDIRLTLINVSSGQSLGDQGLYITRVGGVYILTIDSSDLETGKYVINITLIKQWHENVSIVIYLTINEIPTAGAPSVSTINVEYDQVISFNVTYIMGHNGTSINGATVTYVVKSGDTIVYGPIDATPLGNGVYNITFYASAIGEGTYRIEITLEKAYHASRTYIIDLEVSGIRVASIVAPTVATITWSDDFNFSVILTGVRDGRSVTADNFKITVLLGGVVVNVSDAVVVLQVSDGEYVIVVHSGMLNVSDYLILVQFYKLHYDIPLVNVTARVTPIVASVSLNTDRVVLKNPVTGTSVTKVEIMLREVGTNAPISDAVVEVLVIRGEVVLLRIQADEMENIPGLYVAYIDWSNIEPGDYTVRVNIKQIQRGKYVREAGDVIEVASDISITEVGVSLDYFGGSTVVGGKRYPNVLVYPPLVALLLGIGFLGYRYYSWIKLPIEVREIIKLIENIRKGVYEYEAPTREDLFEGIIAEHLGLE